MGLLFNNPLKFRDDAWQKLDEAVKKPVPSFEMYLNAAVVGHYPAAATTTKVPFDTVVDNYSGDDDTRMLTNDNFIVRIPGIYVISGAALTTTSIADGLANSLAAFKNNTEWKRLDFESQGAAGNIIVSGSCLIKCVEGDVIDLRATFGTTAGTKTAAAGRAFNFFQAVWLSP